MSGRALPAALASLTLMAAWLGAAVIVSSVVTRTAFAVLPTRALAGAVVGPALRTLFITGILMGVGVALMNARIGAGRGATASSVVFAAASACALVIAMRISQSRNAIGAPMDLLDPTDPRRIAFGRLHGLSVLCLGVGAIAAFAAAMFLVRHLTASAAAAPG